MTNLNTAFDAIDTDILGLLAVAKAPEVRKLIRGALERKLAAHTSDKPKADEIPATVLSRPASDKEMARAVENIRAKESARNATYDVDASDNAPTDVLPVPEAVPTPLPSGDGFVITKGTREGYVEIRFDDKPDAEVRKVLKAAKFGFTKKVYVDGKAIKGKTDPRWYGKAENLPAMFKSALRRAA